MYCQAGVLYLRTYFTTEDELDVSSSGRSVRGSRKYRI